jgi:elongation factor 1 alpha-like protein
VLIIYSNAPVTPKVTGVKQMTASRRKEIESSIKNASDKEHINLIVIGHVDAGKSTLMGHMLYLLGITVIQFIVTYYR